MLCMSPDKSGGEMFFLIIKPVLGHSQCWVILDYKASIGSYWIIKLVWVILNFKASIGSYWIIKPVLGHIEL
jgi:hypothetical protein